MGLFRRKEKVFVHKGGCLVTAEVLTPFDNFPTEFQLRDVLSTVLLEPPALDVEVYWSVVDQVNTSQGTRHRILAWWTGMVPEIPSDCDFACPEQVAFLAKVQESTSGFTGVAKCGAERVHWYAAFDGGRVLGFWSIPISHDVDQRVLAIADWMKQPLAVIEVEYAALAGLSLPQGDFFAAFDIRSDACRRRNAVRLALRDSMRWALFGLALVVLCSLPLLGFAFYQQAQLAQLKADNAKVQAMLESIEQQRKSAESQSAELSPAWESLLARKDWAGLLTTLDKCWSSGLSASVLRAQSEPGKLVVEGQALTWTQKDSLENCLQVRLGGYTVRAGQTQQFSDGKVGFSVEVER